ncbi:hypothetical protein BH10ACT10_BH10ACT10_09940 [soil metagenome]
MADPNLTLSPLAASDRPDVERIYVAGIATGHATFETEPPSWDAFDASKLPAQRLVAVLAGQVVGQVVGTRRAIGKMSCGARAGTWRDR